MLSKYPVFGEYQYYWWVDWPNLFITSSANRSEVLFIIRRTLLAENNVIQIPSVRRISILLVGGFAELVLKIIRRTLLAENNVIQIPQCSANINITCGWIRRTFSELVRRIAQRYCSSFAEHYWLKTMLFKSQFVLLYSQMPRLRSASQCSASRRSTCHNCFIDVAFRPQIF